MTPCRVDANNPFYFDVGKPAHGGAEGIEEHFEKLADLREKGLLDEQEYKASKAKLLGF